MSLEAQQDLNFERTRVAAQRAKRMRRSFSARLRGLLRSLSSRFSSSLTRRIVVLNLGGLVALLVGFLYLNQFREGLIDARVQSLQTQAEIIAAAVAASATVDTDSITIDPEKLLQLAPGESYGLADDSTPSLQIFDQSRTRRARAAPPRLANANARAHL
ncbi:Integral membrane sensor signal transduction histidine kinase (fragment) [Methylocella tundrae]|uniref:Integral membrane sensor signal transduction histidine kinase n=1 Tax=Methylocella tundrae TaxID=227605 RepID=A0A4U8YVL2_METTU